MLYMYHKTEVKIVGIKNFELIAHCIKFRNELFIVNFTENIDCLTSLTRDEHTDTR